MSSGFLFNLSFSVVGVVEYIYMCIFRLALMSYIDEIKVFTVFQLNFKTFVLFCSFEKQLLFFFFFLENEKQLSRLTLCMFGSTELSAFCVFVFVFVFFFFFSRVSPKRGYCLCTVIKQ